MATHTIERRAAVRPLGMLMGAFLILHGIAHFVGTTSSLAAIDDGTSVRYLAGAWTVSDPDVLRVLAVTWAIVGVGVVLSGVAMLLSLTAWRPIVAVAILVSLGLSVVALPAAVVGVVIDALILLALVLGDRIALGHRARPMGG